MNHNEGDFDDGRGQIFFFIEKKVQLKTKDRIIDRRRKVRDFVINEG